MHVSSCIVYLQMSGLYSWINPHYSKKMYRDTKGKVLKKFGNRATIAARQSYKNARDKVSYSNLL